MKRSALFLSVTVFAVILNAQTPQKTSTSKPAGPVHSTTAAASALPPGVPRVAHGPLTTAFSLRYEDIKVGTGAAAEPNKLYKVAYTGWLAATGVKFDSSADHPAQPIIGKDGKPEMGPDGKPKSAPGQPLIFPQGMGRLIPGVDQGFTGMHVGGKRRLFVPWQLAYGTRDIPDHGPDHPGIPSKSDLIFDVELVDIIDMPTPPPARPGMSAHPMPGAVPPHPSAPSPAPGQAPPAGSAAPANPSAAPAQPATPAQPTAPATPPSSTTPPQPK